MRVLVTLPNILEYGLDVITGNSRADLLARAAEMEKEGYELYVQIPDVQGGDTEAPEERNAFDHFGSDLPEPDGATHLQEALDLRNQAYIENPCSYHVVPGEMDFKYICNRHGQPSKHSVTEDSHEPCLMVDPYDT